ncbi:hypothetical protein Q4595_11260 [Wenyingzhuangia sp. 1_MG-2023]|nr:hypothetical protein [Wenyingzhuangia sp. 1_MG-2023]
MEYVIGIVAAITIFLASFFLGPFTTPYSEDEIEINKALEPVYFYRPFSILGQGHVDSLEVEEYKTIQRKKYSDYTLVENWFNKKDRPLNQLSGNFYKVNTIIDTQGNTKETKENIEECLYVFSTNDYIYVIYFDIYENSVEPYKIHRFTREYGRNSAHELFWNTDTKKVYKEKEINGDYHVKFKESDDDLFFTYETGKDEYLVKVNYNLGEDIFYEKEFSSKFLSFLLDFLWAILCCVLWIISITICIIFCIFVGLWFIVVYVYDGLIWCFSSLWNLVF